MNAPTSLFLSRSGLQLGRFHQSHWSDQEYRLFNPADVGHLAAILINVAQSREPDEQIGGEGDPYLLRWHLRRQADGNIYLHQMLRDDDERALHDHPWQNTSIVLSGEIEEVMAGERWPGQYTRQAGASRILKPGMIVSRGAEDAHLLKIHDAPVWTLFITANKTREWGFHTKDGWVHWLDFPDPISGITPREKQAREAALVEGAS